MDPVPELRLSDELAEKLLLLWERTGDEGLRRIATGQPYRRAGESAAGTGDTVLCKDTAPPERVAQELQDWVSTALMNCYKDTADAQVFALLYELNEQSFLQAIQYQLRRTIATVDARDVLQEVFLNIYRYPHRFAAEKAESFRNWGHRIVRNTLLKFLKTDARRSRFTTLDEEVGERADVTARTPFRSAADAEIAAVANRAFLLYLNLYLIHFDKLSDKERRALTMVEVEGRSYKSAAKELEIRLENLKMVIFRGRRKIWRGMNQALLYLDTLSVPDRSAPSATGTPEASPDRFADEASVAALRSRPRSDSLGSVPVS